jgi:dTDP-4-dehydrorhamnose 3,5-epimerase
MIFTSTPVDGCFVVEVEPQEDERGLFARTYDAEVFAAQGLEPLVAQASTSYNRSSGTLRGLHLQRPPHEEAKLVRCVRGRVFDVAADLRPRSPSYAQWHGVELSADRRNALYVPPGVAHGYVTLTDDCELSYRMSVPFEPGSSSGVRWDDPTLAINWPLTPDLVSARDLALPFLGG